MSWIKFFENCENQLADQLVNQLVRPISDPISESISTQMFFEVSEVKETSENEKDVS